MAGTSPKQNWTPPELRQLKGTVIFMHMLMPVWMAKRIILGAWGTEEERAEFFGPHYRAFSGSDTGRRM
jgi:hypothetical protein